MDGMNNGGGAVGMMQQPGQPPMQMQQMMQQEQMNQQMQNEAQMQQLMQQQMQQPEVMAQMQLQQQQQMGQIQPGMGQPNAGEYGFAARPQVVRRKKYRDPYREYIKVAPQNIMYDRRVVRGNTFAALVIPVNMQPDPALVEKQRLEEAYVRQKQKEMRQRRMVQERQRQKEREDEREQNLQMQAMQNFNQLEQLSDVHNMEDEFDMYPDYRIDRAPDAVFIPNPEGDAKCTQIWEGDPLLFDYENEVEPILQVLVGKSIEHARIEVIEEYEGTILKKHKGDFFKLKEAELMEAQRLEDARVRRNAEIDRRMMQTRLQKNSQVQEEKRNIARVFAKKFLNNFKRNTMQIVIDQGGLRRPVELSLGQRFVPRMLNQVYADMNMHQNYFDFVDAVLNEEMSQLAAVHKSARFRELDRRAQVKKAEERRLKDEADAKEARKKRRAMLREKRRLQQLTAKIIETTIKESTQRDQGDIPNMPVYDVRDLANSVEPSVVCIGGMVGELIISFTCMLEYIQSTPELSGFRFKPEEIEKFIKEMLVPDYPASMCEIKLAQSLKDLNGGEEPDVTDAVNLLMDANNVTNFGLKFLLMWRKDLFLSDELVRTVLHAICTVVLSQPAEPKAELGPEDAGEDEDIDPADKLREVNEKITRENEVLNAAKARISIEVQKETEVYNEDNEVALLKLSNIHEPVFDSEGKPTPLPLNEDGEPTIPAFKIAELPTKIPLVQPKLAPGEDGKEATLMVYHSEATFMVRRQLIEMAKRQFPELEKAETNSILDYSYWHKYKTIEERFEDELLKLHGYSLGCHHQDLNHRIVFVTTLDAEMGEDDE